MANQNQKQQNGTEQVVEQQQVETPVQVETPQAQVVVQVTEPKKEGIGRWLKKHWKGVTAAVTGTGAAVASAIVAYKKGKAAGMNCMPPQDAEDYSLNPNE